MNLSLAITTHNRSQMTIKSFENVLDDPRITEIIIVDDASDEEQYKELSSLVKQLNSSKVLVLRNEINLGMSMNKLRAISQCNNPWVIIFDSDNVLDTNYLDAFDNCIFDVAINHPHHSPQSIIYCPSGAMPKFDYSDFEKCMINKSNVKGYLTSYSGKEMEWLLNTCNYIVNKRRYIETYEHNREMRATDTIWHNYNHLRTGGSFYVMPNSQYQHLVHEGSGWRQDRGHNKRKAIEVKRLIEEL